MKFLSWIILPILTIVLAAFAIVNRHLVIVSVEPFPLAFELPLYAVVFTTLFLGLLLGGLVVWWRQGRWRKTARANKREVGRLHQQMNNPNPANTDRQMVQVPDGAVAPGR